MTKANPPPSLRSSSRRIAQKNKVSVTKAPKRQQALARKTKKNVVNIRDFKKQSGKIMYLVERDGVDSSAWETEDMIESLDILTAYQQKVQTESGYSIEATSMQIQQDSEQARPSRASKTRAVIALKQPTYVEDGYFSDDNDISRKSVKTNSGTKKPANKKSGGRKTKAEILADIQHAERLDRKRLRSEINPDQIPHSVDQFYGKECCLQCAANTYRDMLENNDLKGLKAALKDKSIPIHSYEDNPNGLDFIQYAIVLQREKFAEVLEEHDKTANRSDYPDVPLKYRVYSGGNTGRNRGLGEYQSRSFRQVEEARGNRVGNAAFYKGADSKRTFMNVEEQIKSSKLRSFMPFISKDTFRDEKVIGNYLIHFSNGSHDVYYAASSGSRLLAKNLLERVNLAGRSTFNLLHEEVLKFENNEPLTSYRKIQILKMASDASNVTPYHFAAINPTSTYLSEFYEALDPAERMQTDVFGRSVAFYAAVSETSACLEFLESKGFNLSLVDKYKMSPLMQAARFGRSHNVEILIKHLRGGPEVTETSPFVFQTLVRNRRTALHYAAFFGHAETCRVLIKYNAPVECVENLDKQTPLLYAAKNGNVDCVRVLIEEGKANPEKGDKFSRTALHYACMNGHTEVVKYLLSQGVNSNAYDSSHNTPIHFASAFGYINIVHLLIEYGSADPSTCNVWRSTPCSVANMKGHVGIVKYLLSLPHTSIDVNFKDQDGSIMLQHSINEPVITPLEKKTNIEKISMLLAMKADVNSVNLEGNTSLHTLVSNISFLKLRPKDWETFYHVPSRYHTYKTVPHDEIDGAEYQKMIGKLLIENGVDLNIKNSKNETALAIAMRLGNHHLVTFLIESGAQFWIDTDEKGNNFFHYFGYFIARINRLQPHNNFDTLIKDRFLDIAKKTWAAVLSHSALHMAEIRKIINMRNNEGYTPWIYAVDSVVKNQREAMIREKEMILSFVFNNSNDNMPTFGSYPAYQPNKNKGVPSRMFEKSESPLKVDLTFSFDLWIKFMREVVVHFKPNMNECITLPLNFKKNKPKAKKSDYPALTGYTALHIAAQTQCTDLIQFLLENGSKPNVRVKLGTEILSGNTPMLIAYHHKKDLYQETPNQSLECTELVKKRFTLTKPDFEDMLLKTVECFIKFKACPFITNSSGDSVLLRASANMDSKNLLQICNVKPSKDGNVNSKNEKDETPLMMAVDSLEAIIKAKEKKPDVEIIKYLLKANSDPNIQYENGDTVLMKVIRISDVALLEVLLENSVVSIDHNIKNKKQENALIIACKLSEPRIALCYLSYLKRSSNSCELHTFDCEKNSALSCAAKIANLQVINDLLFLGANPNFNMAQHIPLIEAVSGQNIDVVKSLLNKGASINDKSEPYGNSALHTAIILGKHRIVKLLLEHGADFNMVNSRLQSPMHLAVETTKKQTNRSFRIEHLLMKAGANVNVVDFFGRTPLHYVFVESDLIPITRNTSVISKKVKQIMKEIKTEQAKTDELDSFSKRLDLDEFSNGTNTESVYLHKWIREAKKIQLDKPNADECKENKSEQEEDNIIILDEEKDSLKVYCDYGWEEEAVIPARFDPIDILKYLSDSEDLKYDIKDEFGRTPLHYAACVGAFSCTSLLVEKNVDINALDSDNNGPIHLALRNNYVDYSVMLCNFGATVNNDVILKNGKSTSTFGFSLSQSLINMAYLIMDKGVTPIESIRESLKNGKFHLAEILLESINEESISATLHVENQNIWHIVSDFKPFNNEIWEEYVEDIIEKLVSLDLPIFEDSFGRTPIHYAAKHGQTLLLRRLLAMPNVRINITDKDGYSELDYAVANGLFENVQELLNAGASVSVVVNDKKPSLVFKAVELNNYNIVELLLHNNAPSDEDSKHGRRNAVMIACQNKDLKMLNLLISHGANLDTPSYVERKDKSNKKYTVLLHPIFAASFIGSTLLEVMLKAGANTNVYGPDSKPEFGRSCFMYNVSIEAIENQQILLKYKMDLNSVDPKATRTIFYQFFFGKMKYGQEFKDTSNSEYNDLKFDDAIYEKMVQNFSPEVNLIDEVTGMTPLELAIREKNLVIIERLLLLGANINIESCNKMKKLSSNALNPSRQKIPAIIYAIIQNNLKLVKFILEHAKDEMNWMWQDAEKRNVLSYIAGGIAGLSHESIDVLKFVAEKMKSKTFKKLIQMQDIHGLSPVDYAHQRHNKELYKAIIHLDPTSKITKASRNIQEEEDSPMDIDYISTQTIDRDAEIEREILQKEKNLEKAKEKKHSKKDEDKTVKVDSYSKLAKVGYVMLDENEQPYDTMLIKVELRGWGVYTNTSFYKMSIIHNKVLNLNILWTRWGSYGEEGQHQRTPYLNVEEAITEFKAIFKSKTGNIWEDRSTSFVQKQGRYGLLETAHHPKDVIVKDFNFLESSIPAQLPYEVINVMKLICNYNYLSRVYEESHIDMPLGQVPQSTIEKARQLLIDVEQMTEKHNKAKAQYSDKSKILETKMWEFKIAQKCVEYARLLPRNDDHNKPFRSLLENYSNNFKKELSRMADLSYVGFAANVILAAKHHIDTTNPLQYAYHALNCSLRTIVHEAPEYQLINNYMQSTATQNYELVHLLAVNRADEEKRFRPFEKEANRMLLWHGSRIGNFMGILKQGLRVNPRTSSSNGAMLGSGIYFGDTFAKSLSYSTENYGTYRSAYRMLMLCEVALGSETAIYSHSNQDYNGLHSMKGEGQNIPDPDNALYDADGVCVPMGPCIPFSRTSDTEGFGNTSILLNHNEYAVYDENRVKIRYLLIIRESTSCFLCSKPDESNLQPLQEQEVKKYNYIRFNEFEREVVEAYLTHQNISTQEVFDQDLDEFIESGLYKKKWDTPLDLCKDSKVCRKCVSNIITLMLEKRVTSSNADIPEFLLKKPQCMYGKECRTQSKMSHIKKYQHWLKENVSEEKLFSIKQVGIPESDMETEDEAEDTGDETETDSEAEDEALNDSDDYMETD